MRPAWWFWPPVLWMALILVLSTELASAQHSGRLLAPLLAWLWPEATALQVHALHQLLRKGAHVVAYAVLAGLWFQALAAWGWRPAVRGAVAVGISVGWAVVDETLQALSPARTGTWQDVGVDAAGALAACLLVGLGWRRSGELTTSALLWLAAVGGAGALALDVAAGTPSGVLWVTAPTAAVILLLRRLRRSP